MSSRARTVRMSIAALLLVGIVVAIASEAAATLVLAALAVLVARRARSVNVATDAQSRPQAGVRL